MPPLAEQLQSNGSPGVRSRGIPLQLDNANDRPACKATAFMMTLWLAMAGSNDPEGGT